MSAEGHPIQSGTERSASLVCAGKREAEIVGTSNLCRYVGLLVWVEKPVQLLSSWPCQPQWLPETLCVFGFHT